MSDIPMRIYEFGPFRVDTFRRLLLRDGLQVRLPAKAFEILVVLLEGKGRVVEKDELMRRVWPDAVVEENNLTVNISALRKSLGESPGEHRYLVTIPGRGYQFVAEVRQHSGEPAHESEENATSGLVDGMKHLSATDLATLETNAAASQPQKLSSAESAGNETSRPKRGLFSVLGVLLALTISLAYFGYSRHLARSGKTAISSIAVLPFENKSDDPNVEYLADGISESLINSLSQLPQLKVIARSSSFRYKGKDTDPQEVAKALGVEAILTGRLTQRGDSLVISTELMDARDRTQIWGEQYNRKLTDLVSLEGEIARDVSQKLRTRLSATDEKKTAKNYTENVEAYQLYLKGRFHAFKLTRPELQKGVSYFQQAIAIDPSYALAYVGLADAYRSLSLSGDMPPAEVFPQAKAAAIKAIEIDDTLAEAHSSLGNTIMRYDWDWNGAETQYKRALELDPNSADAHVNYAGLLSSVGRHAEALAEAKLSIELDPLNLRTNTFEGQILLYAGQTDEALARFQKTFELDPNFWLAHLFASRAYSEKRMYAEAIAEARKARELTDVGHPTALLAYALAKSGKQAEARGLLEELLKLSSERYVPSYNIAVVYDGLDEREETLAWLERAFKDRDARLLTLKVDPTWNDLRDDSRFKDLMRRVGLPL
ncbi:MAG: winged helix-turn-helix domain-containing protein [Acidobacteriota bacterium]